MVIPVTLPSMLSVRVKQFFLRTSIYANFICRAFSVHEISGNDYGESVLNFSLIW